MVISLLHSTSRHSSLLLYFVGHHGPVRCSAVQCCRQAGSTCRVRSFVRCQSCLIISTVPCLIKTNHAAIPSIDWPPRCRCRKCLAAAFPNLSAYKAIHACLSIVKSFAETEDTMPLNVALEMRFTKHSSSPLSPAYGKEVR